MFPPLMFAVVVTLPVAFTNTVFIDANLSVALPSVRVLFVSGRTFDPNDPFITSWSPIVTSCVTVKLFAIAMSLVTEILPVNSLTEPAKLTTLALPAIDIVTFALFATLTFDVPFGITVGVIVVLYSSWKLSLHLI